MTEKISIFWHRRDFRIEDNAGLYHALKGPSKVVPIFIFDANILEKLENPKDRRVTFIFRCLEKLKKDYERHGSSLRVFYGKPKEIIQQLVNEQPVSAVYTNGDYEPSAKARDEEIAQLLKNQQIGFHAFKDQVIFEKTEVVKDNGSPYLVFTPYSRSWKGKLSEFYLKSYPNSKYFDNLAPMPPQEIPTLESFGFSLCEEHFPDQDVDVNIVKRYHLDRDFPAIAGTTRLSVHLRFGTVSIRKLARLALKENETWLNELIWREFYMMILWNFPHVVGNAFKLKYDRILWRNDAQDFLAWCEGRTGYPIVDAGMRELNETGFMHNRVRMITASFLVKHLLIDWRWGEAYFAEKLLDFELASNNGGWQWAAGSGCDAAPYFRVFSPERQTKKFDPKGIYIRKWVPEIDGLSYPQPIVEHSSARNRALEVFKAGLNA